MKKILIGLVILSGTSLIGCGESTPDNLICNMLTEHTHVLTKEDGSQLQIIEGGNSYKDSARVIEKDANGNVISDLSATEENSGMETVRSIKESAGIVGGN